MKTTTDLHALLPLCAAAIEERYQFERESETAIAQEAVQNAQSGAVRILGEEAAAALAEWLPLDQMAPDTLQASSRITPTVWLRYTAEMDEPERLELVASCPTCSHVRETRISSLTGLADALYDAGVR